MDTMNKYESSYRKIKERKYLKTKKTFTPALSSHLVCRALSIRDFNCFFSARILRKLNRNGT